MSATEPHGPDEHATARPAGYTPPPPAPGTNAMAILSMVSSILGLTLLPIVGSIIGVVTGHIARRQIRESGEQGHGPATAGVAIGYIGLALLLVAVIVVLLAIFVFGTTAP